MISYRKMNPVKRIAFAASGNNRKSLIEWSYYNQEILKNHHLVANGAMADILQGTIGVPVTRLADGISSANHQLVTLIAEQKIDILIFFWDPIQSLQQENGIRYLQDLALAHNIIIASNLATADFVLSSVLMDKTHSVPVMAGTQQHQESSGYGHMPAARQAVLKVNTIH